MSKTKIKIEFTLEDHKLRIKNKVHKSNFDFFMKNAPYGVYFMEVWKKRGVRTTGQKHEASNQNGYYWSVVIPRVQEYFKSIGVEMTKEVVHNGMKNLFLQDGMCSGFPQIKSTQELDKWEWEQMMQNIRDHFWENYKWHIPEPNN